MIEPTKHLDLDLSVLRAGAVMLAALRKARVMPLFEFRSKLVAALGSDGELMFVPTVNFLYLIGRIEYHARTDSFEYVEVARGSAPHVARFQS